MVDEININHSNVERIEQHGELLLIYLSTHNSEFVNNETIIRLNNPEKKKIEVK